MVKHIVMWKFRPGTEAEADRFLTALATLRDEIAVIRSMEVGRSAREGNDCDAVLTVTFDSFADLDTYRTDPRHLAVSALCKAIRTERHAVDILLP